MIRGQHACELIAHRCENLLRLRAHVIRLGAAVLHLLAHIGQLFLAVIDDRLHLRLLFAGEAQRRQRFLQAIQWLLNARRQRPVLRRRGLRLSGGRASRRARPGSTKQPPGAAASHFLDLLLELLLLIVCKDGADLFANVHQHVANLLLALLLLHGFELRRDFVKIVFGLGEDRFDLGFLVVGEIQVADCVMESLKELISASAQPAGIGGPGGRLSALAIPPAKSITITQVSRVFPISI